MNIPVKESKLDNRKNSRRRHKRKFRCSDLPFFIEFIAQENKLKKGGGVLTNGRGFIKNRTDIDQRPKVVNKKMRFGDLEIGTIIDTIIGNNHKGALLTINNRVTGLVWIRLLRGKEAAPLTEAAIETLKPEPKYIQ